MGTLCSDSFKSKWQLQSLLDFLLKSADLACGIISLGSNKIGQMLIIFLFGFPTEIAGQKEIDSIYLSFVIAYVLWFYFTFLMMLVYVYWLICCQRKQSNPIVMFFLGGLYYTYLLVFGYPIQPITKNKGWKFIKGFCQLTEIIVDVFRSIFLVTRQKIDCSFCSILMIVSIVLAFMNACRTLYCHCFAGSKKQTDIENSIEHNNSTIVEMN